MKEKIKISYLITLLIFSWILIFKISFELYIHSKQKYEKLNTEERCNIKFPSSLRKKSEEDVFAKYRIKNKCVRNYGLDASFNDIRR